MATANIDRATYAVNKINRAYMAEDYDRYERLIAYYANEFGIDENLMEDWATDIRMGDC